ncbi:MAG: hypothetical protein AB1295_00125 [Candidatus Micrarchaeota archaeon]
MADKRLKSWFMKNIILPNNEIIDKPGFIIYQFQEKGKNSFMREILFPELMLADIESRAHRLAGKKADLALYRAGKRWGYRFADGALFPKRSKTGKKAFRTFFSDFVKFCETVYSAGFSGTMDLPKMEITMRGEDVIICSISGRGEVFLGAWVGVWGYMCETRGMEGKHTKCQGRGAKECVFVCAPAKTLGFSEKMHWGQEMEIEPQFFKLNSPHEVLSEFSLKRFLEMGNITYEGGFFRKGNDRLVLHESSSIYFIEDELERMGAKDVVFDSAFDYFREFSKWHTMEFFIGFLMATGWGEIKIFKEGKGYLVMIKNFPWTSLAGSIGFGMVRGAFSGFLSGKDKEEILFKRLKTNLHNGYLELTMRS